MNVSHTAGIAAAVVTVALGGLNLARSTDAAPAPVAPTAAAVAARPPATTSLVALTKAESKTKPASKAVAGRRLGAVIHTGLDASKISEWVLYGVRMHDANYPGTTFAFAVGEEHNNGRIDEYLTVNEYQGSSRAAGFHPMEAAKTLENGMVQPAFGYYVGTPARITAKFDGRTVTAHLARWSHDRGVTVFWFDPQRSGDGVVTALNAYDAHGRTMIRGHVEVF
jgi:hypothetical protein